MNDAKISLDYGPATVRRYFRLGAAVAVAYSLLISHNLAWLNPSAGRPPNAAPSHSIPYGWEFSDDSGLELHSAIDFPEGMARERNRIARPLKNAVISAGIEIVGLFHPLTPSHKLALSYAMHHLMILLVSLAAYFIVLRFACRYRIPIEGVFLCWIWYIVGHPAMWSTSHAGVSQMAIAVFVLAVLQRCVDLRPTVRNGEFALLLYLYWVLAGCLTLVKQDYAPFLAVLTFALYRRWFWQAAIGVCAVATPFILYRVLLRVAGIEWYSHEMEAYGQGTWFFSMIQSQGWIAAISEGLRAFRQSLAALQEYYGLLILLAAGGFIVAAGAVRLPAGSSDAPDDGPAPCRTWQSLAFILLAWNIIQTTAAHRPSGYMLSDSYLPLTLWAAIGYAALARVWTLRLPLRAVAAAYLVMHACIQLNQLLKLPWQHPLELFGVR